LQSTPNSEPASTHVATLIPTTNPRHSTEGGVTAETLLPERTSLVTPISEKQSEIPGFESIFAVIGVDCEYLSI